jgi:hypothetical protein
VLRVDVQIIEGRLIEGPTPDAHGMDRRAFGEFIGPGGELASYAVGWTTGNDHGRVTVGIGRGNPGGATFHTAVFANGDGHAFQLVDEPFERVPEGGPNVTADQARAHEDMPFVWWLIDRVFERDRRAQWLCHWLLGTVCIQTRQVFEKLEPVLLIGHDDDDGLWQLIGSSDAAPDGKIGHLSHAVDEDHSLLDVLDLRPGETASRRHVGGAWTRQVGYSTAAD